MVPSKEAVLARSEVVHEAESGLLLAVHEEFGDRYIITPEGHVEHMLSSEVMEWEQEAMARGDGPDFTPAFEAFEQRCASIRREYNG